jgi:hypothetical protein
MSKSQKDHRFILAVVDFSGKGERFIANFYPGGII